MEIQYYGANCIRLVTKHATVIIDDNLAELGLKSIIKPEDIALYTMLPKKAAKARLVITDPGEYEVSSISIHGIAVRGHMDDEKQKSATIYRIDYDDVRMAIIGHAHPNITANQFEEIGLVDVVIVPVGGNGYTLDGIGALKIVKEMEPKILIPTHYADPAINYQVPMQELENALKNMAMEPTQTVAKYKIKTTEYTDKTQLIVLERQ